MRKLATIQTIKSISPIEGADKIDVCEVLGWKTVVEKGKFKEDEKIIFIEIDSILPEKPEYEFLRDSKFRIKTRKFRKQVSQGLVLPISSLPENYRGKKSVGTDVTEALGIIKYDPQLEEEKAETSAPKSAFDKFMRRFSWYRKFFVKKSSGKFPEWIRKTDEERIQNMPRILDFTGRLYQVSEKLDGQSATYFLKKKGFGYEFGVCSRNNRLPHPNNSSWWTVAKTHDIENVLRSLIGDSEYIILQGEILGSSIQGNKYKVSEHRFYAFNLTYPNRNVTWIDMSNTLKEFGLVSVPILMVNTTIPNTVEEVIEMSKGKSLLHNTHREGLVFRDYENNISFKAINPDFLLKNNE